MFSCNVLELNGKSKSAESYSSNHICNDNVHCDDQKTRKNVKKKMITMDQLTTTIHVRMRMKTPKFGLTPKICYNI